MIAHAGARAPADILPLVATLGIDGADLVVGLSRWEQAAALRRGVRVPLAAVREVAVEPEPWAALRGVRAPGTGWPGVIAYGVRRLTGDRPDFAAVLGKRPVVRIELAPPSPFGRVLVSVADVDGAIARIRAAAG